MRTEEEMFSLILSAAEEDARIRAVFLNGSRANPEAPRDKWQDFDVAYLVRDLAGFLRDSVLCGREWLSRFGEELIFQFPDLNDRAFSPEEPGNTPTRFGVLMQFTDGNRIDLQLWDAGAAEEYLQSDRLTVKLLDKDGLAGELLPPTDADYRVKRPSPEQYAACCNEFYWVSCYVAKGLWRRELPYAHEMLDCHVREMLLQMLAWRAGADTGFSVNVGKCGKYLENYLSAGDFSRLKGVYAGGEYAEVWHALQNALMLFRDTAVYVGKALGYPFPERWHEKVSQYCRPEENPEAGDTY